MYSHLMHANVPERVFECLTGSLSASGVEGMGEGWEVLDRGICSFWLYSASKACGETLCCCNFSTVKWQQLQALLLLYRQHGYVSLKLVLPQYQQGQLWQVGQHWRQQGG